MIQLHANFEGANPGDAAAVEQTGESAFVIRPYSEDGDDNYKFSLLVRVSNNADRSAPAELTIDWADPVYMSCRDYVLLGRRDQWHKYIGVHEAPEESETYLMQVVESLVRTELRGLSESLLPYRESILELQRFSARNLGREELVAFPGHDPGAFFVYAS